MTYRFAFIAPLAAVALASCSAANVDSTPAPLTVKQSERLDKALAGKVAGKPQTCLTDGARLNMERISDDILLYRAGRGLVYKTQLDYACRGLGDEDDIMVIRTFAGNYCKGDTFQMVDRFSNIPGPICRFGAFVPYRKADTNGG
ncbi:hypothetical protein ACFOWX_12960 [Sphingorhabdus arenilitoris]|uniref:Lipoprotein n=1 Tax=Sphingorhabdus arenilitoris TaxID=1490041 RepID=A0ABV8RIV1_9SPHN